MFPSHGVGQSYDRRLRALSRREITVLRLIAMGKSSKQIASEIGVSVRTVDFHRANLIRKTGLRSVAELVRYADSEDLIDDLAHSQALDLAGRYELSSTEQQDSWEWQLLDSTGTLIVSSVSPEQRDEMEETIRAVRVFSLRKESYRRRHVSLFSAPVFSLDDLQGNVLAMSPEFPSPSARELAIQLCKETAPTARIVERESSYSGRGGEHEQRL